METKYLKINPADNVVVAISDLKAGEAITVDGHAITLKEDVPAGHKVTLKDFAQGENIIKYGYPQKLTEALSLTDKKASDILCLP